MLSRVLVLLLMCRALAKDYFMDSGLDFLRRYGGHYNLFSRFYPNTTTAVVQPSVFSRGIEEDYLTRNYSQFRTWEVSCSRRNFTQHFYREDVGPALEATNNKLRFGDNPHDRFLDIFLNEKTGTLYLVGTSNEFKDADGYGCSFLSPSVVHVPMVIERGFLDVMKKPVIHVHASCPLPPSIASSIEGDIRMHFTRGGSNPAEQQQLISNIVVKRPHSLDRRSFNISLSTMVDTWNEPMLAEWLVYHLLVGVEHFYLFDISRDDEWSVKGSTIEPFLLANIVTIVYFPFVPLKLDDAAYRFPLSYPHAAHGVHTPSMNIGLHRFGHYTTFLGFQDLDEFFCLSEDLQPKETLWGRRNPMLEGFLSLMAGDYPKSPGIMFDTLEMGCDDEENYHHSKSPRRPALTTTCTITGGYFEELKVGHGKYYAKPDIYAKDIKYVATPHRIDHYWVTWTKPTHGGLMYHFNRFRYSNQHNPVHFVNDKPAGGPYAQGRSNVLRNYTLRALNNVLSLPVR